MWGDRRVAVAYDAQYWGAVFPLGMYTVCTYHLAQDLRLPFLFGVSDVFIPAVHLIVTLVGGPGMVARPDAYQASSCSPALLAVTVCSLTT